MNYLKKNETLQLLLKIKLFVVSMILVSCNFTAKKEDIKNDLLIKQQKPSLEVHPSLDSGVKSSIEILDDVANHRNTVYVKDLKYIFDGNFKKYALITIENTTKDLVLGIQFRLDGYINNGCSKSYDVKRKIKISPGKSIRIKQSLAEGDCEKHTIEYVQYILTDGSLKMGV